MRAPWFGVLCVTALVGGSFLAYLMADGGLADPLAVGLASVGAAVTVTGPVAALGVDAPRGVLVSGLYALGDDRLRLRVTAGLGPGEAAALALQERALIEGLFEDHQAPYPGALSTTLRCPDELRPAEVEPRGGALFLLGLQANDRLAFGGCAEDLLHYRATVGAFQDGGGTLLIRIEYFEPKDEINSRGPDVLRSFRWTAARVGAS